MLNNFVVENGIVKVAGPLDFLKRNLNKGFGAIGGFISKNPIKSSLIGLGVGAGLGALAMNRFGNTSIESAAQKLVEAVIRKNPMKYSNLTPEQKRAAVAELVREFSVNLDLKNRAISAADQV